jgi:para-nitrobenzyl esterase
MRYMLPDVRDAIRGLMRSPGLSLSVILIIGLALGLNTTMPTVFNAYVLRPFAVQDPYSLYQPVWITKGGGRSLTQPEFDRLRRAVSPRYSTRHSGVESRTPHRRRHSLHCLRSAAGFCLILSALIESAQKLPGSAPTGPVVQLPGGTLSGIREGNIAVFKGIPFAAPPTGPLRWRPPQPVAPWTGIREATKPSHACVQNTGGDDNFLEPLAAAYGAKYIRQPIDPSEDCLYLNVWSAQLEPSAHLPVMVWIHGGSNVTGNGAERGYDGSSLASRGVVLVTVNYRLGVMGFFAHPELTAESPHHSSGNYGLLDQMAALEWVQRNISQFGGDPSNVTLFGESAGSIDALTLMSSPLTTNLFRQVIAESGPVIGLGPAQNLSRMETLGAAVGKLEALRKLPAPEVAKIESRLIATQFKGYDPNASIVDGWLLPQSPAKAFATGATQRVNLLVGINAREFSAFRVAAAAAPKSSAQPAGKPGFSEQLRQFADTARPLYGSWTDLTVATYMDKILLHGDAGFDQASNDILGACPTGAEAALTANAGARAFVYRFDRSVPGRGQSTLGAFHSLEIPYVFGTLTSQSFNWLPFDATDQKLSRAVQSYWTNFAKLGDPNGPGLPDWPAWNTDREPYLAFSQTGDAIPQQRFSPIYCHLSPDRLKQLLVNY